jgi:hypothetical protein
VQRTHAAALTMSDNKDAAATASDCAASAAASGKVTCTGR